MFCLSFILDDLNLTVFVSYYCIQKSKLKLEMGFTKFHNDYLLIQDSGALQQEHMESQ